MLAANPFLSNVVVWPANFLSKDLSACCDLLIAYGLIVLYFTANSIAFFKLS